MLFLEDHIRAVQPALAARRDACDAMLCCMSANEVTRLTRLGRFDMAQEATGALAMLKKLRGGKKGAGGTNGVGSDGRAQMRMLRRLPKLMKFIPGTAQDVRTYFLALQYWLAGSDENLANLVRMLVGKYCGERQPRAAPGRGADLLSGCRPLPSGLPEDHRTSPRCRPAPPREGCERSLFRRRPALAGHGRACCCCAPT